MFGLWTPAAAGSPKTASIVGGGLIVEPMVPGGFAGKAFASRLAFLMRELTKLACRTGCELTLSPGLTCRRHPLKPSLKETPERTLCSWWSSNFSASPSARSSKVSRSTTCTNTSMFSRKSLTYVCVSCRTCSGSSPTFSARTKSRVRQWCQTRCLAKRKGNSKRMPPSPTIHQISMWPFNRSESCGQVSPFASSITLLNTTATCTIRMRRERVSLACCPAPLHSGGQAARMQLGWKAPRPAICMRLKRPLE
mmetsp:Transcript_37959/g.105620  ORF Transcript_37959/g.105620 Transcript_37959/m.105620 type:complete len:252 (-) Transcript_37959:1868-2623(-)